MSQPWYHYAIYWNTKDFPGEFVVRRWEIREGGAVIPELTPTAVVNTLEEARAAVPYGLAQIPRSNGDDPVIIETWLKN